MSARDLTRQRALTSTPTPRMVAGYGAFGVGSGVLIVCLSGGICAGDGEGLTRSGDVPSSPFAEVQAIFDRSCTRCHEPGGAGYAQTGGDGANGLDLTGGRSRSSLVDQPTFLAPEVDPVRRVRPGEPDESFLLEKVASDTPKAGRRMPFDGPPFLSAGEIESIRAWIADGALED